MKFIYIFFSLLVLHSALCANTNRKLCQNYLSDQLYTILKTDEISEADAQLFRKITENFGNNELLYSVFKNLGIAEIVKLEDHDLIKVNRFYEEFFKNLNPEIISDQIKNDLDGFHHPKLIYSETGWVNFLENETVELMLNKLAKISKITKSARIGIALSNQFSILLSNKSHHDYIDDIVEPMIDLPTFLKNSKYFDIFPELTRRRVKEKWLYAGMQASDLIMDINFIEDVDELRHACGTCELMPRNFNTALLMKLMDIQSTRSTLILYGKTPIGLVKHEGDHTFLALKNVRNLVGELILVKGGVYAVSSAIALKTRVSVIDLENFVHPKNLFLPLTYMRDIEGPFTTTDFKNYLEALDIIVETTSAATLPLSNFIPPFIQYWSNAKNKRLYLESLDNKNLLLVMKMFWDEINSPEDYLGKLSSNGLRIILIDKWSKISNPESFLNLLESADKEEVLIAQWPNLKDKDKYIEQISEYTFGKILANHWSKLKNPEEYLGKISDPYILELVIKHKR
jgi:hypothetical protein